MKVPLYLTTKQYDLLLDLVFHKYNELNKEEDSLLAVRDFSLDEDRFEMYQKKIEELREPLEAFGNIYVQLQKLKE